MVPKVVNGIPIDVGPYIVLVSLFVLAAIGFSVAVNWLNKYVANKTADLETRVQHLEDQVAKLNDGNAQAVGMIVQAIALMGPDQKEITDKLVAACRLLG